MTSDGIKYLSFECDEPDIDHGTAVAGIYMHYGHCTVQLYDFRCIPGRPDQALEKLVQDPQFQDVDIVNMSFGGDNLPHDEIARYKTCIQNLSERCILVAAAGNCGSRELEAIQLPASRDGVIAVGAHNDYGKLVEFSSTGRKVEFTCPGENIATVDPKGKEISMSGTSFAAPMAGAFMSHVLAVADALEGPELRQKLTHSEVMSKLCVKMCERGIHQSDGTGYGKLQPNKHGVFDNSDKAKFLILFIKDAIREATGINV